MTTGLTKELNLEKQIIEKHMGCMAGFLQIFDRHHILTGKRLYSAKRLPPSPIFYSTSESEKSSPPSPANSTDLGKPLRPLPKPPLPLPISELKQGSRSSGKFSKEAPRLSLDSRATTDAKGGLHPKQIRTTTSIPSMANGGDSITSDASDGSQHHRSPSVIARLMGLETFPNSSDSESEKKPELRRSASESRVSKDLFQSRFSADGSNYYSNKQPTQSHAVQDNAPMAAHFADPRTHSLKKAPEGMNRGGFNSTSLWKAPPPHRKSFFDSGDIFPETNQRTVAIYGEIQKRIKMRGIDEPSKDLEALKQILEALQLKGLLHSKQQPPPQQQNQVRRLRNFVYDESPIVLMKPSASTTISRRIGKDYSPSNDKNQVRSVRRNYSLAGETSPSVSSRRERNVRSPTTRSSEGNAIARRSNSPVKPVRSPKLNTRRVGQDSTVGNRSPRIKKSTNQNHRKEKNTTIVVAEDASSPVSGSSITTSTDTERPKGEEYNKGGRNILSRCDKLLHSIAEMAATDMQPSPVSVLDPSFYKDESLTPSPVTTRRNLDFKDQYGELEEEICSPVISPIRTKRLEIPYDSEFIYISDILRASHYLPDDSDIFQLLEKQQYINGNDTSKVSMIQRKLIFDTINEILDWDKLLPPWKGVPKPSLDKVWSEFQTIRENEIANDLFENICGVLKRDLARDAITGWGDCDVEMSEAVLDIERLIFKDLVSESIRDMTELACGGSLSSMMMRRRKLVF